MTSAGAIFLTAEKDTEEVNYVKIFHEVYEIRALWGQSKWRK